MDSISSTSAPRVSRVHFSAGSWEYSKLWIVNLVLCVVTLGIYSAWAHVRNTQYIYGHTQVESHRLQYLATPMQLLKGRLIALVLFIAYVILSAVSPALSALLALTIWLASPYLMVQGLRFSLRHTAYRNVRFNFTGSIGQAYLNFLLLPLIGAITLGLAMPWAVCQMSKYMYQNIRFGDREFNAELTPGTFYKAAFLAFLAFIVPFVALIVTTFGSFNNPESGSVLVVMFSMYALMFLAACIFRVIVRNYILNMLESKDLVEFRSDLELMPFMWVMLTNALLVVFTLGLGYPVAEVRTKRMLASATEVHLYPAIDDMAASSTDLDSAFGEEMAGFFDSDLSLT